MPPLGHAAPRSQVPGPKGQSQRPHTHAPQKGPAPAPGQSGCGLHLRTSWKSPRFRRSPPACPPPLGRKSTVVVSPPHHPSLPLDQGRPLLLQGGPSRLPAVPRMQLPGRSRALGRSSPRGRREPACANDEGPVAAGWVSGSRSDEHSWRPSAISQTLCGGNTSTTNTGAQTRQSPISEGCWKPTSPNATFLLQDHSSQPVRAIFTVP